MGQLAELVAWSEAGPRLEQRVLPEPSPGEILLRVELSGLCGTDLFKLRHGTATVGTVLGHEVVGVVESAGAEVEGVAAGDRVAVPHHVACGRCALCERDAETACPAFRENLLVPGGFSTHLLVHPRAASRATFRLPPEVRAESGVFLEPAACVLRGIRRSGLEELARRAPSEPPRVAVQGGGGMGLLHLLVLRALLPAVAVDVVEPKEERRRLALTLGAAQVLSPAEVAEHAGRYDVVFDTVGGSRLLETALLSLRPGGTVLLFAHASPDERAGFALNTLFRDEKRVLSSYSGGASDQRRVHSLIVSGALDASPLVSHRLPLRRFADGVAAAMAQEATKVLFLPEMS